MSENFNRPTLEPIGKCYRLTADWLTDCKGVLAAPMTVPAGFVTDGASIPRALWTLCGSPMDVPRVYAAIVHDYLYDCGGSSADRKHADRTYRDYQIAMGISRVKARIEYRALRLFGGGHWNSK